MKRHSLFQIISIQAAGAICLPVLIVGQRLGKTYGFAHAAISILIGNFLLFLLGIIYAKMAVESRQTTVRNAEIYFGNKCSKLFAFDIILTLIGWFSIQLALISSGTRNTMLLGLFITLAALKGIKSLSKLAYISIPILISTIIYTVYKSFFVVEQVSIIKTFSLSGISLVLATAIMAVIDLPNYHRFSKSLKESTIGIFILLMCVLSSVEIAGAYIGIRLPIEISTVLVLAGLATNNANLYSSAVTMEIIFPLFPYFVRTLILGTVGTLLACLGIMDRFEEILSIMGFVTSSMGAVIAVQYIFNRIVPRLKTNVNHNLISWGFGVIHGALGLFKINFLTGIITLDSFIISGASSCLLLLIRSFYEKNNC